LFGIPFFQNCLKGSTDNNDKRNLVIHLSTEEDYSSDSDDPSIEISGDPSSGSNLVSHLVAHLLSSNGDETGDVCKMHFEGALDGSDVLAKVVQVIEKRGFTPENTRYAQSVCPDEINQEEGDITDIFTKYMGEVFNMGGLAGLPFIGRTGFAAFTHHVADEGHCFVLMAPRIGISATHKLGKYTRDGQHGQQVSACGAAVGALEHCECGKKPPSAKYDFLDSQMNFIIRQVNANKKAILKNAKTEDEKMKALVHQIWKIGKYMMLDDIVHANFGGKNSKLLVLTGIQINMPRPYQDMFQPLTFTMLSKDKSSSTSQKSSKNSGESAPNKVEDLFQETFGHKAPNIFV